MEKAAWFIAIVGMSMVFAGTLMRAAAAFFGGE